MGKYCMVGINHVNCDCDCLYNDTEDDGIVTMWCIKKCGYFQDYQMWLKDVMGEIDKEED